jgi:cleavage and polyadenylation specificity factor subunit 2
LGCKAQIFATIPTAKMAQMFLYDTYQSKCEIEEFDVFNLDNVDETFDNIQLLKYSQKFTIKNEKGTEITIAPYLAGHTLG